MAKYDYQALVDDHILHLVDRFGTQMSVTRIVPAPTYNKVYDPVTMGYVWVDPETQETFTTPPSDTLSTFSGNGLLSKFEAEEINDTSVLSTDLKILTIELPEPQQGDVYTIGGVKYRYVNHSIIRPADVVVLYKIQVRV